MRTRNTLLLLPVFGLLSLTAWSAPRGSHTWDFTEVFSNADGTIQFIELQECCGGAGETGLPGHTLSSNTQSWVIPGGPLTPPTSNKHYLIATAGFAALPGAPVPDAIIPSGQVPFFSNAGDTLNYVPWDTWNFGPIPTDGVNSLKRSGMVSVNDPTNYAGATGSVNATPVTTYCTGKTTSLGCVPFLTTSGDPSATIGAGPFNIFSNDHIEFAPAIYMYSFGKGSLNFHGGKLCIKAPFGRISSLIKATDQIPCVSCPGMCRMFKRNFNEFITSGVDPNLTAGQQVRIQVRQRDVNDPTGFADNFSDGVAFTIGP